MGKSTHVANIIKLFNNFFFFIGKKWPAFTDQVEPDVAALATSAGNRPAVRLLAQWSVIFSGLTPVIARIVSDLGGTSGDTGGHQTVYKLSMKGRSAVI